MVSLDDTEKNKKFVDSEGASLVLLSDEKSKAAEAYGVLGFGGLYSKRWTFYIDGDGVVRYIDKSVEPSSHGADVARQLDALGFPRKMKTPTGGANGPKPAS